MIFVTKNQLLSPKAEKARYDLHENDPSDKGYRQFLNQVLDPLLAHIGPPPQKGLDFGSGPGPALAQMLTARGYKMSCYDPFYAPNPEVLDQAYDFVTCTEAIEHFHEPARDWDMLLGLTKSGGWLGIMTKLIVDPAKFPDLHYITDETHVSFFSRRTFNFLASQRSLTVKFFGDNVILIHKPAASREINGQ